MKEDRTISCRVRRADGSVEQFVMRAPDTCTAIATVLDQPHASVALRVSARVVTGPVLKIVRPGAASAC